MFDSIESNINAKVHTERMFLSPITHAGILFSILTLITTNNALIDIHVCVCS